MERNVNPVWMVGAGLAPAARRSDTEDAEDVQGGCGEMTKGHLMNHSHM